MREESYLSEIIKSMIEQGEHNALKWEYKIAKERVQGEELERRRIAAEEAGDIRRKAYCFICGNYKPYFEVDSLERCVDCINSSDEA